MKRLALAVAALALSGVAYAQTTEIRRTETPEGSSTTVRKENWDGSTTTKKTIESTGAVGCETKSVTESDEDGSTTKTKTRC